MPLFVLTRVLCRIFLYSRAKRGQKITLMHYWEIIADNLSKAGWNWGCDSAGFQPLGVILPVNDWATILSSRTTNVSVPISYTLSAVSAVHRM